MAVHSGLRTRSSRHLVSVRNRPLSVDSASMNPPCSLICRYDMPDFFHRTRSSSFLALFPLILV